MGEKLNGLYRDFIIHPGETLQELIQDRGMNQHELALRTGMSEKHISKVINGSASITPKFASALEVVLGNEAEFWLNLQNNYDLELLEYENANAVSDCEINILKELKPITTYLIEQKMLLKSSKREERVVFFRKLLLVNNLTSIPDLTFCGAFRASAAYQVNPYVLFAWKRLCEIAADKVTLEKQLDTVALKERIPEIRALMFADANDMRRKLTDIFAKCGIKFCIVKHFTGAPVQGFIELKDEGELILCMTIRGAYADIFWFTLFHEIAHILNGDILTQFIDFSHTESDVEKRADDFASCVLLDPQKYNEFAAKQDFTLCAIRKFSEEENVPAYITIGRLQKEHQIDYSQFSNEKCRYIWA